jgi:glycogen synthase
VGIQFEPGNLQSLSEAILSAWCDPSPPGPLQSQAARFSWRRSAEDARRIYESV